MQTAEWKANLERVEKCIVKVILTCRTLTGSVVHLDRNVGHKKGAEEASRHVEQTLSDILRE